MQDNHFSDDRPISTQNEDRLGYTEPAKHIANSILNFSSPEGLVLGLEGEWGSGKSSFINLIIDALNKSLTKPEIIKFSPWLISTRSALLGELFQSIANAAIKIPLVEEEDQNLKKILLSKTGLNRDENRRNLAKAVSSFGNHLSKLGYAADIGEALGFPYAGTFGKSIRAGATAISNGAILTLDKEKENLQKELRKLSRKIVVFIDDLDRLEPNEAAEIVRLVRAVVDFPNIVYVLCYSRKILAQSLDRALSLTDGNKYIDKIVQVTFSVPKPEPFELRRIFKQRMEELFPGQFQVSDEASPSQMLQRLNEVIDYEGGRSLSTPRDIARATNAMRLCATPVIDKIDLADMTWLQLIRIRNYKFYEWIEEYLNTASVLVNGATLSEHGQKRMIDDLNQLISEEKSDRESIMNILTNMLPGIADKYLDEDENSNNRWKLFHQLTRDNSAKFIQDSRLGSPQHFRYYLAFSKPSMALEDADFHNFIENAENDIDKAIQDFSSLSNIKRPQGGVWSEAIIDRLVDVGIERVPEKSIPGITLSLAYAMDKLALNKGAGDWGEHWIWNTAKSILRTGLRRMPSADRSATIYRMFQDGEAIGWLTSILRDETFAHGIAGSRKKTEDEWLLTKEEYQKVSIAMKARYKNTPPETLMKTPAFSNVMFGWMQLGEEEEIEVKDWVESVLSTDDGLIALMESMRSWSSINGQVKYPLRADNLSFFCDVSEIDNRLNEIAQQKSNPLAPRARMLLEARALSRDG